MVDPQTRWYSELPAGYALFSGACLGRFPDGQHLEFIEYIAEYGDI